MKSARAKLTTCLRNLSDPMLTSRLSRPLSTAFRTRPTFLKTVSTAIRPYSSEHNDGSNPDSNKTETKRQAPAVRLPFVPVINIPEQELAHTAFFALHRPLLGLANEDVPYFGHVPYPPGENDVEGKERVQDQLTICYEMT